jgi:integrase-like protein
LHDGVVKPRGQPWRKRLLADALCLTRGERYLCAVWDRDGRLCHGGSHPRAGDDPGPAPGDGLPCSRRGRRMHQNHKANGIRPSVYATDPTTTIGGWNEAWEAAKGPANVSCRFHDLRHTACTRMLESGTPLSVAASIMGWEHNGQVVKALWPHRSGCSVGSGQGIRWHCHLGTNARF